MEPFLDDLKSRDTADLARMAQDLKIEKATSLSRQDLIFEIQRLRMRNFASCRGTGVLETLPDGFGFLRAAEASYLPGPDDIYVSPSQIRKFHLRDGDVVTGQVRAPKEAERYFALIKLEEVNGHDPERVVRPLVFDNLVPGQPTRPIKLEHKPDDLTSRVVDLAVPLAFGQRVIVWSPLRGGRTTFLRRLAKAIRKNHPESPIFSLLLQERPEDLADARREMPGDVVCTAFDEPPTRHIQVADLVVERVRRLAEYGKDVVLIVDSLTRLVRAHHEAGATSGRTLPGGLDPAALQRPRRLLATARSFPEGGSVTVIAVILTGTENRLDEGAAEAFEGVESARITLSRDLVQSRLWPPVDLSRSWSRNTSKFLANGDGSAREAFLRTLSREPERAIEDLRQRLRAEPSNDVLLHRTPSA